MSDTTLLVRATLGLYRDAARDASRALGRHLWVIVLLPAYSILLGMLAEVAGSLGFAGGLVIYLAAAACMSSLLTILDGAVANERVRPSELAPSFGRYLGTLVSVLFVFWIIQLLLSLILQQNAGLAWLAVVVNAAIFLLCNPLPELIYQGSREGLALVDDAIQFTRENAVEWLLPLLLLLSPIFLLDVRAGLLALAELGPTSALGLATRAFEIVLPAAGWASEATALGLASVALLWVLLFRGFLFRTLSRSGRRQRIFEARMRGL